jgi:hypothetical protein
MTIVNFNDITYNKILQHIKDEEFIPNFLTAETF